MKQLTTIRICRRCFILVFIGSLLLMAPLLNVQGQEHPPRPISVTVNLSQNLSFGTFCQGNAGGTVIVYPDGSRSATGDILLLNVSPYPSTALFDVVANPGTIVSILPTTATLTGSNGGTLTLNIGDASNPFTPVIINTVPPSSTLVRIGGVLIVLPPPSNMPGIYSGTFDITFVQE